MKLSDEIFLRSSKVLPMLSLNFLGRKHHSTRMGALECFFLLKKMGLLLDKSLLDQLVPTRVKRPKNQDDITALRQIIQS